MSDEMGYTITFDFLLEIIHVIARDKMNLDNYLS